MERQCSVALEPAADPASVAAVEAGLADYNLTFAPPDGYRALNVLARSPQRRVVGGLLGETYWGWLHVRVLWVEAGWRGSGVGSRLLEQAEQEARRRGCSRAHLTTMDFQAEPFYRRRDYRIFGVLEDLPPGHRRIFMEKWLGEQRGVRGAPPGARPQGAAG